MAKAEYTAEDILNEWRSDPVLFVQDNFNATPDEWQRKFMYDVRDKRRAAASACKGPGKSCVEAWIGWWILACFKYSQGIACSITAKNLQDGLWKELAYWQSKSKFLLATFEVKGERIVSREHPKFWWLSARSFPQQADKEQQANTLAGLHADVVFALLDEVGDYPMGVVSAANAIFSRKGQEAFIVAVGNPTNRNGPLYDIVTTDAARWAITHITGDPDDPMRSPKIDIAWAQGEIDKYGRENPWVMVNVLGLFPPSSSNQLIDINTVIEAEQNDAPAIAYRSDAYIWGLDPGRFGDDESALARRQGQVCFQMKGWRGKDGTELGDIISAKLLESENAGHPCDCLFVDVGGIGASVYDRLKVLGWDHIMVAVDFGSAPNDDRYDDKRTEMWMLMAEWAKLKACLPRDPVLRAELTGPTFSFSSRTRKTRFILESKDDMKKRGVPSPNRADALCLTFAAPVAKRAKFINQAESGRKRAKTEYNPMTNRFQTVGMKPANITYDPLQRR